MTIVVLTIDQIDSRTHADAVGSLLERLAPYPAARPFERTAGDELQGVLDLPESTSQVLELLIRDKTWNIGIGIGAVEEPLPPSARAGRGPAYLHARTAVTSAKSSPWNLRVVGDDRYRCRQLETTLLLWAALLSRRTQRGWEVVDLAATGLSYDDVGRQLGITQSAVSQRAQAAGLVEGRRARELTAQLVSELVAGSE